jgi:hypothetical protein
VSFIITSHFVLAFTSRSVLGGNDLKRRTAPVRRFSSSRPGDLVAKLTSILEAAYPELKAVDPVYLLSRASSGHQGPHTDAPAGRSRRADGPEVAALSAAHRRFLDAGVVPLSVLVPLEDGGRLRVWDASHRVVWMPARQHKATRVTAMKGHVVDIPPGHFVMFRQDLVHAGDGYEESHLRGHFFLDPRPGADGAPVPAHRVREIMGETITHVVDDSFFVME